MLEAESLIQHQTPDQDLEQEIGIDRQKLALLGKLVSDYSDQETGLSSSILNCRFSDTKSLDVSLRLKSEMGDQLNDFLKIVGEFGERDRQRMIALRTVVLKMIEALDKLDWDLFNKRSRDLNNVMDGMETVFAILKND